MAEYWKSTPNYWCKFCSTFVRDTKLSRQHHEATGRHKGNIDRSLRNLDKAKERENREKQKAQDEVARLNGIVKGRPAGSSAPRPAAPAPAEASLDERKRQMAQLAAMGVTVPQEHRAEMAMSGDWQSVPTVKKSHYAKPEDDEDNETNAGAKKRKLTQLDDEQAVHEDEEPGEKSHRQSLKWGNKRKEYKKNDEADLDIGALMGVGSKQHHDPDPTPAAPEGRPERTIKREDSSDEDKKTNVQLVDDAAPAVFFKKIKKKPAKT